MRSERMGTGRIPAGATNEAGNSVCFLGGTYLNDLDDDDDDDTADHLEAHGCLSRLRVWTARLLYPRRHSRRLAWASPCDFEYNPLH